MPFKDLVGSTKTIYTQLRHELIEYSAAAGSLDPLSWYNVGDPPVNMYQTQKYS